MFLNDSQLYKVFKNLVIYNYYSIEQFLLALSACDYFIDYQMTNKNEILPDITIH